MRMGKLASTMTAILVIGLSLGLMAGCSDDDSPTDPGGTTPVVLQDGTITAIVDGNLVDFSHTVAGIQAAGECGLAGANDGDTSSIVIDVVHAVGAHDMADPNGPGISLVYNAAGWFATSGTVTVTTATDTRLVGTFSGTFEDFQASSISVTGGTFDVALSSLP